MKRWADKREGYDALYSHDFYLYCTGPHTHG